MTTVAPNASGRLIDLSPELSDSYQAFFTAVFDGGSLDPKCRAAAALAAAMALGRQDVVRSFLTAAKQVGLTNEDIGHAAAIVDVVRVESHQRVAESTGHNHHSAPAAAAPKASKSCC
jgi:alkylhydroperoxidase/carboxymuconolactone decarboxylase family protein YurZ